MGSAVLEQVAAHRLVPVVTIADANHAAGLGSALKQGGLPCAEVTFRTDAAAEAIEKMAADAEMLVGAGTVLTVEQAQTARKAGAKFIITPGLHAKVVDYCLEVGIPIIPGVATPTDIAWAMDRGLRVLKFFPAETLGGVPALKAICAPYREIQFVPTGGITPENVGSYLELPQVVACGGSWLATPSMCASGNFNAVERVVREAVELVARYRM